MTGLEYDAYDGLDAFDEADGMDADDPDAGFWADPAAALAAAAQQAVVEVAGQVAAANEQRFQQLRAERAADVQREAAEAMAEKYGAQWKDTPGLADKVCNDALRGLVPDTDTAQLTEYYETVFLAGRERAKPNEEAENAAYWDRVVQLARRENHPWQ